ncbi:MAG: hypothetical protein LBS12_07810, partial [Prevotellaceae bacterium]|nr:hypothetical protein [Prevotellaceae bacterium]
FLPLGGVPKGGEPPRPAGTPPKEGNHPALRAPLQRRETTPPFGHPSKGGEWWKTLDNRL